MFSNQKMLGKRVASRGLGDLNFHTKILKFVKVFEKKSENPPPSPWF